VDRSDPLERLSETRDRHHKGDLAPDLVLDSDREDLSALERVDGFRISENLGKAPVRQANREFPRNGIVLVDRDPDALRHEEAQREKDPDELVVLLALDVVEADGNQGLPLGRDEIPGRVADRAMGLLLAVTDLRPVGLGRVRLNGNDGRAWVHRSLGRRLSGLALLSRRRLRRGRKKAHSNHKCGDQAAGPDPYGRREQE
jgi:hypothetical protein